MESWPKGNWFFPLELINRVLSSASSSLYYLSTLRSKCLPEGSLHLVARATTLTSVIYASPAWWGYTSSKHRNKLEALINRMKRRGFLYPEDPTASDLAVKADEALFRAVCTNPNHVLSSLLPRLKQHQYNLRSRVHNFSLPPKDDRNFVSRSLYRNIYWASYILLSFFLSPSITSIYLTELKYDCVIFVFD